MAQTWLITGASRGIGRALAEAVLAAGDQVVAGARPRPDRSTSSSPSRAGRARAVALDVTDRGQAQDAPRGRARRVRRPRRGRQQRGLREHQRARGLHRGGLPGAGRDQPVGRDQRHARRAARSCASRESGASTIQISSAGGRSAVPGVGPYITAKWAVEGFSSVLAQEVAHLGVRVTIIEPGGVRTDWAGSSMTVPAIPEAGVRGVGRDDRQVPRVSSVRPVTRPRWRRRSCGSPRRWTSRRCGCCWAPTPTRS